jgi:predicted dehydrogenase
MSLRVGLIGTGAIANLHARAYKNIGYAIRVCTDVNHAAGRRFAGEHGAEFVDRFEEVCRHPEVDFVDVCTFPDFRLQAIEACAAHGKHVQVQKPMSISLETARRMLQTARDAGILLGVVSQHRFGRRQPLIRRPRRTPRQGPVRRLRQMARRELRVNQRQLGDRGEAPLSTRRSTRSICCGGAGARRDTPGRLSLAPSTISPAVTAVQW